MKDTAYTSQALAAHTDNAYFNEPSRLQMFHLLSHTDGAGGASLLVDGLQCAKILKERDPYAYQKLQKTNIVWHASGNEGISISSHKYSVINHFPYFHVRWNNDDRGLFSNCGFGAKHLADWYEAARLFDSIIKDQANEYWEQLKPGRPLST
jgi:trimethyllysine dioxygenase